jgi:hypothetical protein
MHPTLYDQLRENIQASELLRFREAKEREEVPSGTTEARLRQLGGSITWYKYHAKAHNFPTRASAELFRQLLEQKGYAFTVHSIGEEGTSICYHAPEPSGNVLKFVKAKEAGQQK